MACLDSAGAVVWARNLGVPDNDHGHSASLDIWRNLLLVQLDQALAEDEKSKLVALDCISGRTVWETTRPLACSWSSPVVISAAGQEQIIACGEPWVIAYNPANGAELWTARCLGGQVVPSPISVNGLVLAVSVDGKLAAIRPDGQGDVTQTHVAWTAEDGLPSICSPVCNGEFAWLLDSGGLMTCYDAADGKKVSERELDKSSRASPTLVNDLLLLLSDDGVLFILKAGTKYELVRRIELAEQCQASPAFQPGRMYLRTKNHLYCFGTADRQ